MNNIRTMERVPRHTAQEINEKIAAVTRARVLDMSMRLEDIDRRLEELEREWDIERTLEANAAAVTLASLVLGVRLRFFRFLPLVVAGFLMQHAVQGWCPPVPVFRRMGVRTAREIDHERYALKALRGDFANVPLDAQPRDRTEAALRAARAEDGK